MTSLEQISADACACYEDDRNGHTYRNTAVVIMECRLKISVVEWLPLMNESVRDHGYDSTVPDNLILRLKDMF